MPVTTFASVAQLDDAALRDHVVACETDIRRLQAVQAEALAEMGRRARDADRQQSVEGGLGHHNYEEFVVDEIAVLLGCTRMAASHRYQLATTASSYPVLLGAWRAGTVDARKVEVICDQLSDVAPQKTASLLDAAIAYASQRTAPQLRQWLSRRIIAADPPAAEARRQRATAERRVVITPRSDGVSELWALLPSVQARHIQQLLTTLASSASGDDQRTMDQRRADALIDLITGRTDPPRVDVQVVVPASSLLGDSDAPGWLTGTGPITATEARGLAGAGGDGCGGDSGCDGSASGGGSDSSGNCIGCGSASDITWRRLLTDPVSGALTDVSEEQYRPSARLDRAVRLRDLTCRFPGCRRSALGKANGTDLDHTIPWPEGSTSGANLAVLCRHHHRLKHAPGWNASLSQNGEMTWTTPSGRTFTTQPWDYG